jgi:two-component system, OmpR family, sensor histidine kinase BaeS
MRKTMRSKLLLYFLIISLAGILLTSFSILWGFEEHFKNYVREGREENIGLIEEEIIREYKQSGTIISDRLINLFHSQAMTENLFYKLYDSEGKLLADSTSMKEMMGSMRGDSQSNMKDGHSSETFRVSSDNYIIASIVVHYQEELIEADFSFFNTVKKNIYIAAIITILLSAIFSILFSKRLSSGFNMLSKGVKELQNHNWKIRLNVEGLTDEMKPLGLAFNKLAMSLWQEENMRKQFTADLAHELRTPLATLRSQIEAFQDGIWEPTPERLQQSHEELMRLVRMVDELEKLLAAENPKIKLNKVDIEANQIAVFVKNQFAPSFHEKGVTLEVIQSKDPSIFCVDRDKVVQILTNILGNALQYTPPHKKVTISVLRTHGFIGFSIADEGTGIMKEDIPYLFERFYRGDKSRNRKTGGIGIGLSIVKALVEAHQGQIGIESKINSGTTVNVLFPVKKEQC